MGGAAAIGLGTACFGLDYGISGPGRRTPDDEVARIIEAAFAEGVRYFDTAPAYGDAEELLGRLLPHGEGERVVTKTPGGTPTAREVRDSLERSLERLRRDSVHALLVHHADALVAPGSDDVADALRAIRDEGLASRIGVSAYAPAQVDAILDRGYELDAVQVPVNVFDRRFSDSGHLARLAGLGVEVHARSAFLQGLLLMTPDAVPPSLRAAVAPLERFRTCAEAAGLTPAELALGHVRSVEGVAVVVCGVNDSAQLAELLSIAPVDPMLADGLGVDDLDVVDPSRWELC